MSRINTLSASDSKVLASVFDPESSSSRAEVIVDPSLPADRRIRDATLLAELQVQEKKAVQLLERFETSPPSERGRRDEVYRSALAILEGVADNNPLYASVLNNRAQLRRWYWGDRNLLVQRKKAPQPQRRTAGEATVKDLRSSISLASPDRPTDAVSPKQGRLLAQAYTQLGAVYHAAAKDVGAVSSDGEKVELSSCADDPVSWTQERFEEEASRCFYLGGLYGNEVAKALAVHTNPQAKLCGNIVKEAML
ncbi:uncharacterized protein LTR77_007835 [Saxophila tyrrhenica]|uniref:Uncharacterized protein n=1 Tax=Saxophila tyrrhenica TaxID=1690608 RepID=A0AAV9P714_9PEZI|nr:hypothetical protein LTR77_007835 [Saxophila tyrrhenica]